MIWYIHNGWVDEWMDGQMNGWMGKWVGYRLINRWVVNA